MKKCMAGLIVGIVGIVVLTVAIPEAQAIPAFARKYKTSCATCHEEFPRLNAVGESFRLNGYKFPEDMYVKEDKVTLGQDAYKKVWPDAIWPSDIPGLPPLALRVISSWDMPIGQRGRDASNTFSFPDEIDLLSGGAFGDKISFFAEMDVADGAATAKGRLQFESIVGPEHLFNVKVGVIGAREMGFFGMIDDNSLTVEPYLYGDWTIPYPSGFTTVNAFHPNNNQPGIELNGFGSRWRYALGVVNGNDGSIHDNNSDKDLYSQFAYKFGGLGFDGLSPDKKELGEGSGGWRDDSVIVSLFGYRGKAKIDDSIQVKDDVFWRLGIGGKGKYRDAALGAGFVLGNNDDPYGTISTKSVASRCWFVETEYFVYPWLVPSVRYEGLSLDLPKGVDGLQAAQDRQRFIIGFSALVRANVKIIVEGKFSIKDERFTEATPSGSMGQDNAIVLRLDFAY